MSKPNELRVHIYCLIFLPNYFFALWTLCNRICLSGIFSFLCRQNALGWVPKKNGGNYWIGTFTKQTPFLMPNQQCKALKVIISITDYFCNAILAVDIKY